MNANRAGRPRPSLSKIALTLVAAASLVAGCSEGGASGSGAAAEGVPLVVVASYPIEFMALSVGGDQVVVENVAASAGDAHHLELSPAQVARIGNADLAVYLSGGFQSAMEDAISATAVPSFDAMGAVASGDLIVGDPHIWLNPLVAADIGDALAAQLSDANPDQSAYYQQNAAALRESLSSLDQLYAEALASCGGTILLTSHEAFGYMAARYDLIQVGVLGLDPEAEPSPARINEISKLVKAEGITTVFVEPSGTHSEPGPHRETKLTKALGIRGLELDPLEVQVDATRDFMDVLQSNLDSLVEGLDCAAVPQS